MVQYDALVVQQEETFRRRIEALIQPVVVADAKTMRIVFVNPACHAVFGWPTEELIGQPVEMLMQDQQAKAHCNFVRKYMQGRKGVGSIIGHRGRQVVAKHKDGSAFHVLLSIADPEDGTFVASFTDLTAQVSVYVTE